MPNASDFFSAIWAFALFCNAVFTHIVSAAPYQRLLAIGTEGVFKRSDPSGEVSRIYIMQSGFLADIGSTLKGFGAGAFSFKMLVSRIKSGYMPGDICRNGN